MVGDVLRFELIHNAKSYDDVSTKSKHRSQSTLAGLQNSLLIILKFFYYNVKMKKDITAVSFHFLHVAG